MIDANALWLQTAVLPGQKVLSGNQTVSGGQTVKHKP
jgi:hypothetical protein